MIVFDTVAPLHYILANLVILLIKQSFKAYSEDYLLKLGKAKLLGLDSFKAYSEDYLLK